MGWVLVAAYLLTAALSMIAISRAATRRERWFWTFAGLFMLAMAVNKQLDLHTAVTDVGRCVAQMQGWYSERRAAQQKFVFVLLTIFTLIPVALAGVLWRCIGRIGLALIGLVFVLCFVSIRAIGIHHVDVLLSTPILSVEPNWVLELSGPVLISLNAVMLSGRRSRR